MQNSRALLFGPLPLRIIVGISFMAHGYPKLIDISRTQVFFSNIGLPTELAIMIGLLEFIGGLVLILGVLTRISSALLIVNMIGAILLLKISKGYVGGAELDLLLLAGATSLLITGPGRISLEWDIIKREIIPRGKKLVTSR
ncbi:MAG: DoxX family protein [Thaumarchaeota archaeon]|nr:DoxX family protein [Nitrososphaerota archaeon]